MKTSARLKITIVGARRGAGLTRAKRKFRFKNPLMSIDGTLIELCATMYDWANYQ
ncbi:MAG TPA: hypothetical protein VN737_24130 [Bryobacteraceae bacterium]|nr:hypothetical protein [Bryobacteraceae bacterium]